MSRFSIIEALAGPNATDFEKLWCMYKMDRWEHKIWWGESKPFPQFSEWVEDRISQLDN